MTSSTHVNMLRCRVLPALLQGSRVGLHSTRALHSFGKLSSKQQMPPRPTIKEEDLEEAFLKGSGPGGQKIVQTFHPNSLTYHLTAVEQNIIGGSTEAHAQWSGGQVAGYAFALAEPEDREATPGRKARGDGKGFGEQDHDQGRGQEEKESQCQ